MQKKPKYFPLFVVLIALCLYMAAAFYQITLPGLHHDEAQEAALMGMQLEKGLPVRLFRDTGFVVANRAFPLMVQDYIGALNAYLAWFAFGIGGVSVESLRSMTILTGMLTLMSAFFAARRLFGWQTAALTVLMLAVHPAFVFWTRQGVIVTSYTLTLTLAALWLMLRWWQGGAAWNLIMAAFLMGVGLWGKLLFIWFIGAVFVAWLVLNLPRFARWIRRRDSLRPEIRTPVYT
ncbi:MAG TPA: glycosyltransferase family 39 protein, partial [Aggregatilineales bacterium]|nr:glycosyltransferase family 39 protein [Aggregatilineales bacterium]